MMSQNFDSNSTWMVDLDGRSVEVSAQSSHGTAMGDNVINAAIIG